MHYWSEVSLIIILSKYLLNYLPLPAAMRNQTERGS